MAIDFNLEIVLMIFAGAVVLAGPLLWLLLRRKHEIALLRQSLANLSGELKQAATDLQANRQEAEALRQRAFASAAETANFQAELLAERRSHAERLRAYESAEQRLKDAFTSLSVDALKTNHHGLMQSAESLFAKYESRVNERFERKEEAIANMVKPVYQSLERFESKVHDLERQRVGAYESLSQQVKGLAEFQQRLQAETASLVGALRSPTARGKWGEIQLKRVVEIAGMLAYCDFYEQGAEGNGSASGLRPDMVIRLPGGRSIVVDAKAPLKAYLDAVELDDEKERRVLYLEHAGLIRRQMQVLSQKAYWENFERSPEFVLLFLPGESFFSAALQVDPGLLEAGVQQKVILATPTTLIALLKTTAYAWRQESMAENAKYVGQLGKELYQRIADLSGHFDDMGRNLKNTVGSFNKAVGTLESRVLVSARRFQELQVDDPKKEVKNPQPLLVQPRELSQKLE